LNARVTILMSDTGGGHRAVATAVRSELWKLRRGLRVEMVDGLLRYAPYPLNRLPDWYARIIAHGKGLWRHGYALSDGCHRARALNDAARPFVRAAVRRLLHAHPAEVLVSTHPLLVGPVLDGLGERRPAFVTLVSDLASAHAWWFDRRAARTLVPTRVARARALACGLAPERVRVCGLPVAAAFRAGPRDRAAARRKLGWEAEQFTALLLGGAEGMAPLEQIARALRASAMPMQLAVVCGRNARLRAQLAALHWPFPAHVYGFMENIATLMSAADVVVTKAGPSTVMEALNCGRPLLLSGAIPGQEEGNVRMVLEGGAGWWTPRPEQVLERLRGLRQAGRRELEAAAAAAQKLAAPGAARAVAAEIVALLPELVIA